MRWTDAFMVRLRSLFRRARIEHDMDAELRFHLDQQIAENLAAGMSAADARASAMRSVGSVTRVKEDCRESLGLRLADELRQDVRHAARTLIRNPGFTTVAVLTLAIGIGANTAIFSVVNAVLLRSLPYHDADRIMTLWQSNTRTGAKEAGAAPANFLDWQRENQVFAEMAAAEPYSHSLSEHGEPESFRSWLVSAGFFQILGVNAALGRTFTDDEYRPGAERVVVLGHGLWQQRFGADPNLVGRRLRLNGQPHTVVGVMPPEFQFPPGRELWAARFETERDQQIRGTGFMPVIARLKPGVSLLQAQHEMDTIAGQLARDYPVANRDRGVAIVPLHEQTIGGVRSALLVLIGAVGLMLLIACSNVVNLLLARASERRREFAVRAALGAGGGRLARQWLTESLCLAVLGGTLGVWLAYVGLDSILVLAAGNVPRLREIAIDRHVLGFASGVSLLTALICGLASALFAGPDVSRSLKEGDRGSSGLAHHRFRQGLVVSQVSLALILLIGAGLLIRSFGRLLQVNPGFVSENILTLETHVWGWSRTPDQQAAFFEETLDRIAALPGVRAAAAVSALPFHDNPVDVNVPFTIEGRPAPPPGQEPSAFLHTTTADYFRALSIPIRRGRFYTRFDRRETALVAVINETLARRYWPDEDPIGKKITARLFGQTAQAEVIGIVGDVRARGLESEPRPELFLPHLQRPYGSMTYIVRTAGNPASWLPAVKQEIWAVNKNLPFSSIATMEELFSRSFADRQFSLLLLGTFAAIALTLAAIGIYGTIGFTVRQRRQEIGVRTALGASRYRILTMVINEGLLLTLFGVVLGAIGASALTTFMQGLLFDIRPTDPLTFAGVIVLLVLVALFASIVPARHATKVDPVVALRSQ